MHAARVRWAVRFAVSRPVPSALPGGGAKEACRSTSHRHCWNRPRRGERSTKGDFCRLRPDTSLPLRLGDDPLPESGEARAEKGRRRRVRRQPDAAAGRAGTRAVLRALAATRYAARCGAALRCSAGVQNCHPGGGASRFDPAVDDDTLARFTSVRNQLLNPVARAARLLTADAVVRLAGRPYAGGASVLAAGTEWRRRSGLSAISGVGAGPRLPRRRTFSSVAARSPGLRRAARTA